MSVPSYIAERANEVYDYDKPYTFDCQILDYIRWQDKTIEDLRNDINELKRHIERLQNDMNSVRVIVATSSKLGGRINVRNS